METLDIKRNILIQILKNFTSSSAACSEHDLDAIIGYLFARSPIPFTIDDDELLSSIEYISMLIDDNNFTDMQQVSQYYEALSELIMVSNNSNLDLCCGSGGFKLQETEEVGHHTYHELSDFIQEDFIEKLNHTIKPHHRNDALTKTMERLFDLLLFEPRKRKITSIINWDHRPTKYHSKFGTQIISTFYYSSDLYLRNYVADNVKHFIYILFSQPSSQHERPLYARHYQANYLSFNHTFLVPHHGSFENMLDLTYKKISELLTFERDIQSLYLKKSLSIWMAYSKFNNAVCGNHHSNYIWEYVCGRRSPQPNSSADGSIDFYGYYAKYWEVLEDKKWKILKSPEKHHWITTDNPGFSIDKRELDQLEEVIPDPYWKTVNKNSLEYFPLSGSYCLRLEPLTPKKADEIDTNETIEFFQTSEKELKVVNALTHRTNPRALISADKEELRNEPIFRKKDNLKSRKRIKKDI